MSWQEIVVSEFFGISTSKVEDGAHRLTSNRPWCGLSFCATPGASIIYEQDGRQYVSDIHHAVFLPQGQTYTLHGIHDGEYPLINFRCANDTAINEHISIYIDDCEVFLRIFSLMRSCSAYPYPVHRVRLFGLFYQMLEQLAMNNSDGKHIALLRPAIEYLNRHYTDAELSIEALASKCGISQTYFRRLFKDAYAVSPKQYILKARMEHAKELLRSSNHLISAISADSGFENECHFYRLFKKHVGITPSEYREQNTSIL